jgi:hypothetical protein
MIILHNLIEKMWSKKQKGGKELTNGLDFTHKLLKLLLKNPTTCKLTTTIIIPPFTNPCLHNNSTKYDEVWSSFLKHFGSMGWYSLLNV